MFMVLLSCDEHQKKSSKTTANNGISSVTMCLA